MAWHGICIVLQSSVFVCVIFMYINYIKTCLFLLVIVLVLVSCPYHQSRKTRNNGLWSLWHLRHFTARRIKISIKYPHNVIPIRYPHISISISISISQYWSTLSYPVLFYSIDLGTTPLFDSGLMTRAESDTTRGFGMFMFSGV